MRKPWITKMRAVAQDIILFNRPRKDLTNAQAMKKFYGIMKKHGLRQGTWSKVGGGRRCNNFEWTMCLVLFLETFSSDRRLLDMFGDKMPKELMAYGKKPPLKLPASTRKLLSSTSKKPNKK